MKIVQLIPGAGNNFYCENCLRDHGLAKALRDHGHDALLVPLYLPIMTDVSSKNRMMPVFFGGINVYLQQKIPFFRKSPQWLDNLFNHPSLLRWAATMQGMTRAEDLAETTLSMLKGQEGHQKKELDKLMLWLKDELRPDAVHLSNALLLGLAKPIATELNIPVYCTLQDEDIFVDPLPEPHRTQVWQLMAEQVTHVAKFITVSDYFGRHMANKMSIPAEKLHRVYNGIDLKDFNVRPQAPKQPVIGFLERQCLDKGVDTLIEAYIEFMKRGVYPDTRLEVAGGQTAEDIRHIKKLKKKLRKAGLDQRVSFLPNLTQQEKIAFLHGITLLSVPARHAEAFGLYILDALAAGVPVVLPQHGAFSEILAQTGGGHLYEPHTPLGLAQAWEKALADAPRLEALGRSGAEAVRSGFSIMHMAKDFAAAFE